MDKDRLNKKELMIKRRYKKLEQETVLFGLIVFCMILIELCFILLNMWIAIFVFLVPLLIFYFIFQCNVSILQEYYMFGHWE